MERKIQYTITQVMKYELRRIVTDEGEKPIIGYLGQYDSEEAAQKYRDQMQIQDEVLE